MSTTINGNYTTGTASKNIETASTNETPNQQARDIFAQMIYWTNQIPTAENQGAQQDIFNGLTALMSKLQGISGIQLIPGCPVSYFESNMNTWLICLGGDINNEQNYPPLIASSCTCLVDSINEFSQELTPG